MDAHQVEFLATRLSNPAVGIANAIARRTQPGHVGGFLKAFLALAGQERQHGQRVLRQSLPVQKREPSAL